jgi:ribonuclease BN (tRNA processing enzyme)
VLRGWSSAVTLLEGSERRWRGGGYFLKWQGHGLVLDPGFDFLRNFHDAGYHGREISVVVVSHNHPDHNTDLKAIDDLLYELWTRRTDTREPYALLWDEDSSKATTFAVAKPEHRRAPIIFSLGLQDPIDLGRHAPKLPFRVTPFEARHGKEVPNAVGMVIELLNKNGATALRIGYTADTGYYDELPKHLGKCDLLIAHISQPSIDELKDASKLKEVHLGYRGTIRLIAKCKPKLTLIGEFWAGFADLRIALVKGVRLRSGVEPVLPAGLSMHVMLPSLEVECTRCGKASPFQAIKVAPCTDSFGSLGYVCPECMLS